jgi:hypothetical protein
MQILLFWDFGLGDTLWVLFFLFLFLFFIFIFIFIFIFFDGCLPISLSFTRVGVYTLEF